MEDGGRRDATKKGSWGRSFADPDGSPRVARPDGMGTGGLGQMSEREVDTPKIEGPTMLGRVAGELRPPEEAGVAELCGVRDVVQERLHLGLWGRLEERKKVLLRGVEHGFVALTGGVLALSRVKIVTFGFVSVGLGAEEEEAGFAMPS